MNRSDRELAKVEVDGRDVIGEPQEDFNLLVDRVRRAFEERNRMGQEVKSAEIETLQAQHAETPQVAGLTGDAAGVARLVDRMVDFHRLSLGWGRSCGTCAPTSTSRTIALTVR